MEFENIKNFSTGGKSLTKIYNSGGVVWESIPMSDLVTVKSSDKIYEIARKESMRYVTNLSDHIILNNAKGEELNYDDYVSRCQFSSFSTGGPRGRYTYASYYIHFKDGSVSRRAISIRYMGASAGDIM